MYSVSNSYGASIQILVSLNTLRLKFIPNTRIFNVRLSDGFLSDARWILYCQTCEKVINVYRGRNSRIV